MSVNRVEVVINSRRYTVLADETEEYINKLAEHINEKVKLVLGSGQNVIGERPVVLAALNICDEYFKCEEAGKLLSEQLTVQNEKLDNANKVIAELKKSNPQISFEEEEAIQELDRAKARIKELEEQVASLKSNSQNNRPYNNQNNQNNQNNRPYNNSYNKHNR